jgi:hypothetical protein
VLEGLIQSVEALLREVIGSSPIAGKDVHCIKVNNESVGDTVSRGEW